jgi:glycosyltransferase involved in cell wall biosynthesis
MRVLFDITLAGRRCARRPVGVLRTERAYAHFFLNSSSVPVQFCRFDRLRREHVVTTQEEAAFILTASDRLHARPPEGLSPWALIAFHVSKLAVRLRCLCSRWNFAGQLPFFRARSRLEFTELSANDIYVNVGAPFGTPDLGTFLREREACGIKLVVLCHDLIPVKFSGRFSGAKAQRTVQRLATDALRGTDVIACNSECTERDLLAFGASIGATPPTTRVVQLGCDLTEAEPTAPRRIASRLAPRGFVLAAGTIEARKNQALLYRIWMRLREAHGDSLPLLVMAGRIGRRRANGLVSTISRDRRTADSVLLLIDATDGELKWLYQNCRFTVFPSYYEGWGLPVAESLAYGKYCVASSEGALPEVTQGLVNHLDPDDEEAWYAEIERLLFDDTALTECETRVQAQYRPTTWHDAGAQLLECVREVA